MSQDHTQDEMALSKAPENELVYRSLDGLAATPEYRDAVYREFAEGSSEAPDAVSRRGFLSVVGASVALAGLTSCRKPKQKILPYNERPEGLVPGIAQHYASAYDHCGYAMGTLVRSNEGRPTKVEGNPLHPATLGGASSWMLGDLLNLYDPARLKHVVIDPKLRKAAIEALMAGEEPASKETAEKKVDEAGWNEFDAWSSKTQQARLSKRIAILMPPTTSPSMRSIVEEFTAGFGNTKVYHWQPIHEDDALAGAEIAFGQKLDTSYDLSKAKVVFSLGADFLADGADALVNAKGFAKSRKVRSRGDSMSRLYMAESNYSSTGAQADHRFRVRSSEVAGIAFAIAAQLGVNGAAAKASNPNWLGTVLEDLRAAGSNALVLAGEGQPAAVHAACHAINAALGSVGTTVTYSLTDEGMAHSCVDSITELAKEMDAGNVDSLICLGVNPVYDAPADLAFRDKLGKVKERIVLAEHMDETAVAATKVPGAEATWILPMSHGLECWRDLRAKDGTLTIAQPLVQTLYSTRCANEVLAHLMSYDFKESHDIVRGYWESEIGGTSFNSWWDQSVHDGLVADTAKDKVTPAVNGAAISTAIGAWTAPAAGSASNCEVTFVPSSSVFDGRFANNSWLQETPDTMTKLVWDNAALVSPATAKALGIENGSVIAINIGKQELQIAAWILPGHADWSLTLPLGYGRELTEEHSVAAGTGFNTYFVRSAGGQSMAMGSVRKTSETYQLVSTQDHGTMADRAIVRHLDHDTWNNADDPKGDVEWFAPMAGPMAQALRANYEHKDKHASDVVKHLHHHNHSAWGDSARDYMDPEKSPSPYQWGMTIDLNACSGCNACVVACTAENNIPSVGKKQVATNREMHWLRIDRYFAASADDPLQIAADNPAAYVMPVTCMQCENAPCESVCPVNATVHSPEGLNDMVYNRCIGTRYCSNNCPYKVRRFNWFDFHGRVEESHKLAFNPDVTVRHRGVMEKCTYCVQRLNGKRIEAKLEKRTVKDQEIQTACSQACSADAITFGNLRDKNSQVAKAQNSPRSYGLLTQLNTRPRTTYLGRITNPNPKLSKKS